MIRIITGTLEGCKDNFGVMKKLCRRRMFDKWYQNSENRVEHFQEKVVTWFGFQSNLFSIFQQTGSGKTCLLVRELANSMFVGRHTIANFSLSWTGEKIETLEELEEIQNSHIGLDDIVNTIQAWNTKDAQVARTFAIRSRKFRDDVDITAQDEIQVPPSIRRITGEIIVPFCRVLDPARKSPDGKGFAPKEILALRFNPGHVLLSANIYKIPEKLLECYDTCEVSTDMSCKQ